MAAYWQCWHYSVRSSARYFEYGPGCLNSRLTHIDKASYLAKVDAAQSLQDRFYNEAGIDVLSRVQSILQQSTDIPVRIAREEDREYFAGLVRMINKSALLHADFGKYVSTTMLCAHIDRSNLIDNI